MDGSLPAVYEPYGDLQAALDDYLAPSHPLPIVDSSPPLFSAPDPAMDGSLPAVSGPYGDLQAALDDYLAPSHPLPIVDSSQPLSSAPDPFSGPNYTHPSTLLNSVDSSRLWGTEQDSQHSEYYPLASTSAPSTYVASWTAHPPPALDHPKQSLQLMTVAQALQFVPNTSVSLPVSPTVASAPAQAQTRSSGGPTGPTPGIKPFIAKLWHILSTPEEFQDCMVWDETGTQLIIRQSSERLTQVILPRFFQHTSIHSLTRQLNVYGFTRLPPPELKALVDDNALSNYSAWRHPSFRRDLPSLITMAPKPSRARAQKKAAKESLQRREEEEKFGVRNGRRSSLGSSGRWG